MTIAADNDLKTLWNSIRFGENKGDNRRNCSLIKKGLELTSEICHACLSSRPLS